MDIRKIDKFNALGDARGRWQILATADRFLLLLIAVGQGLCRGRVHT
jgi:hypothetical protein